MVAVNTARSDPPTPRARAHARAVQRREQERVAHKKERWLRRCQRRERRDEDFRLREQLGLSSPATSNDSSSEEEEEKDDRGQALPDRWEPAPPSPELAPVVREPVPGAGAGVPATRRSTTEAAQAAVVLARATEAPARTAAVPERATRAPVRAVEASGGVAAAAPTAPAASTEPSRKRKRRFSSLR
jgi:hypothetical protein